MREKKRNTYLPWLEDHLWQPEHVALLLCSISPFSSSGLGKKKKSPETVPFVLLEFERFGERTAVHKAGQWVSHAIVMEKGLGSGHLVLQICCFWQKVITYDSIPGTIYEGTCMGDLILWSHTLILLMRKLSQMEGFSECGPQTGASLRTTYYWLV